MQRLLVTTLVLALGLGGSWTLTADPGEPRIPEPAAAPAVIEVDLAEVDLSGGSGDDADSASDTAGQDSEESAGEIEDWSYGIPDPESGWRQNQFCFYTCTHHLQCPNIVNLPRPDCIGGCCVY